MPKFGNNAHSRLQYIRKLQLEGRTYEEASALWREAQDIVATVGDLDIIDVSEQEVKEIIRDWRRISCLVGAEHGDVNDDQKYVHNTTPGKFRND